MREEAVLFLLEIPKGDNVTILAQNKSDGETEEEEGEERQKYCTVLRGACGG